MAHIIGQLESLKTLRSELNKRNITMFNSIKEIQSFRKNYYSLQIDVKNRAASDLAREIEGKEDSLSLKERELADKSIEIKIKLERRINALSSSIVSLKIKRDNAQKALFRLIIIPHLFLKRSYLTYLESNVEKLIVRRTRVIGQSIKTIRLELSHLVDNKTTILINRTRQELLEMERAYNAVEQLGTIIAGAIGEGKVEKQLKKLPNSYYIINDFKVKFNPPLFNRQSNEKIFSIQIDHLVVGPTGIFALETKHWSQKSIESLDLRSPVKQIHRSSYALFVLMNKRISIHSHHWGAKRISVKNILVMTNATTDESFKFIAVKSLGELNGYIQFFDPIFSEEEVSQLSKVLLNL